MKLRLDPLRDAAMIEMLEMWSLHKLKDFDVFPFQTKLTNLRNLDLFNCEVTQLQKYREEMFAMLGSLKYLDGYDRDDKEAEEEEVSQSSKSWWILWMNDNSEESDS